MLNIFQATNLELLAEQFLKDLDNSKNKNSVFNDDLVIVPNISIQDWLNQKITQKYKISAGIAYELWLELERYKIENYFKEKHKDNKKAEELNPLSKPAMQWDLFSYLLHKTSDIIKNAKHPLSNELKKLLNKDEFSKTQEEIQRLWAYSSQMAEILNTYMELRPYWLKEFFNKDEHIKLNSIIENFNDEELREHYQTVLNSQHYLWKELFRENYQKFSLVKAEFLQDWQKNSKYKEIFIFGFKDLTEERINYLKELAKNCEIYLYLYNVSNNSFKDIKDIKWLRKIPITTRELKHLNFGNELVSRFGKLYREREKLLAKTNLLTDITVLEESPKSKTTLLARLQDDIHRLDEENSLNDGDFSKDDSLKIFACHGFNRQLEVLRSEITKWLLADKNRKLEDILILTPSLVAGREGFFAIFPQDGGSDGRRLPAKLSGISNKETETLWLALSGFYQFLLGEFDFLSVKAWFLLFYNCKAYECSYEDLAEAFDYLYEAGFRRGFDEQHLRELGVNDGDFRFSFSYALDRLILAYSIPEAKNYAQKATAFDKVLKTETIRALTKFHNEISELRIFIKNQPTLREIVNQMRERLKFYKNTASSSAISTIDRDVLEEFGRRLGANRNYQKERDKLHLPWKFILAYMENILHSKRNSAEPSGVITIGQLSDMQNLPYKLIAFVGAENSKFPNKITDPRYNLIEIDQVKAGDTDRETADLAAFLDVLSAAQENCWIFYSSHDKENGEKTSPPTAIADLLQYLETNLETEKFAKIHIQKPAAPFDDTTDGSSLWAKVRENLNENHIIKARFNYKTRPGFREYSKNFDNNKIPQNLNLEDIANILKKPLNSYLKSQKIHIFSAYENYESAEPLEVNNLQEWKIDEYLYKNNLELKDAHLPYLPVGAIGRAYAELKIAELKKRLANLNIHKTKLIPIHLNNNFIFTAELPIDKNEELLKNQNWNYFSLSKKKTKHKLDIYLKFLLWTIAEANADVNVFFKTKQVDENITNDLWKIEKITAKEAKVKLYELIKLSFYIREYPFLFAPDYLDKNCKSLIEYFNYINNFHSDKKEISLWNYFANDTLENNYQDEAFFDAFNEDLRTIRNILDFV